jgi:uncharacterized FlaG/YvyC family protein
MSNNIAMIEQAVALKPIGLPEDGHEHKIRLAKPAEKKIDVASMEKIAAQLNEVMRELDTKLSFAVDRQTNQIVIRVMNSATQELIRQIPAEDMLRIAARIKEMLGIVFDRTV